MAEKLQILLGDPNHSSRNKLRDIINAARPLARVEKARNFQEVQQKLTVGINYDVLILGSTSSVEEIVEFVTQLRRSPLKKMPFIIIAISTRHYTPGYVADLALVDIRGLILEPFSTENLAQLLDNAAPKQSQSASADVQERRLADLMLRIGKTDFEALLRCEKAVDASMARELARVLGKTSRFWLSLQEDYDKTVSTAQSNA